MNVSALKRYRLSLPLLFLVACAGEPGSEAPRQGDPAASTRSDTEEQVAKLTASMRELPGELVVTRSTGPSLDEATRKTLVGADKVIHVFSDGRVIGYVHFTQAVPGEAAPRRLVRELGGDIVLGPSDKLPELVLSREPKPDAEGSVQSELTSGQAVGLYQGHGRQWADGAIAYEIDGSFNATEQNTLRQAIGSWNNAVDGTGQKIRVRFQPRYPGDGRSYVRFVRSTDPAFCGRSAVGQNSWWGSNWYSHNVDIVCVNTRTIHHEMGHTAGLFHEQQRCNRDLFVSVTGTGVNCDKYCGGDAADYIQYNYRSVMHYGYGGVCNMAQISPASSDYRGAPWEAGSGSQLDTQDVQAINSMYYGKQALPRVGAGIWYYLIPQNATTRAIAVPASSPNNGTQLVLFDRGYSDQHWELVPDSLGFFEIRNRVTRKCMEIGGFSMSDGGLAVQWDCVGGDNQKWIVTPSAGRSGQFDIINKLSLKSLDASGWTNGAKMTQWGYHSGDNQRFQLSFTY